MKFFLHYTLNELNFSAMVINQEIYIYDDTYITRRQSTSYNHMNQA